MLASFCAIVIDGSAYALYSSLEACGLSSSLNQSNNNISDIIVSGNKNYSLAAQYCTFYFPEYDCACTKDTMTQDQGPAPNCYVFSGGNGDSLKHNCDYVLDEYPDLLDASFGVSIVCLMIATIITILGILSLYVPTIFEPQYFKRRAELEDMSREEYEKLKAMILQEKEAEKLRKEKSVHQKVDGDGSDEGDDNDEDVLKGTSRGGFYEEFDEMDSEDVETSTTSNVDRFNMRRGASHTSSMGSSRIFS